VIEDLEGASVQTARARAGEILAGAPLDNGHIDTTITTACSVMAIA
jgi:hypothetical protein